MSFRIFINYRRADTEGFAGRLYDRLELTYSADRLFLDVGTLAKGADFVERMMESIRETDIVLALIGKDWIDLPDDRGYRRLDDPADYVRLELEAAIVEDKIVIPVLIGRANMPHEKALPDTLKPLARRNAARLTHENFAVDTRALCDAMEHAVNDKAQRREKLAAVARATGIPAENLRPIFDAAGVEFPKADFERAVQAAVDELLARAARKPQAFNDGEEIAQAIESARKQLSRLDVDGALARLRKARAEQEEIRSARARGEARLAREEGEILKSALRRDEAIAAFETAARLDPDDARAWIEIGDIHGLRGELARAYAAYESANEVASRSGDDRDLGSIQSRIGDVLKAQGDLDGALRAFETCIDAATRIGAADPEGKAGLHELARSHGRVGEIQIQRGDHAAALENFRSGHAIMQRLAADSPDDERTQRGLSDSFNRLANAEEAGSDFAAALINLRKALEIRERLAAAKPESLERRRDISISLVRIGYAQSELGDLAASLASHRQGLEIRRQLVAADAENVEWQGHLATAVEQMGDVERKQDDREAALNSYREALDIRERIAAKDPGNADAQWELFSALWRMGRYSDDAAGYFEKAIALLEGLEAADRLAPNRKIWLERARVMLEDARNGTSLADSS